MNIRETILIMTSVAMTALSACELIASDRFGFDLPVGPRSGGINNVEVDFTVSAIRLTGNIIASEGALVAEIMSPSGAVVFSAFEYRIASSTSLKLVASGSHEQNTINIAASTSRLVQRDLIILLFIFNKLCLSKVITTERLKK